MKSTRPIPMEWGMFKTSRDARMLIGEYVLGNDIPVYIINALPETIDLQDIIDRVDEIIPRPFLYEVEAVYVGQFEEFYKMNVNAFFDNGAIYISNAQDNADDLLDDLLHEIAHAVEVGFSADIYADQSIRDEFLGKRKRLYTILATEGYDVNIADFAELGFSAEFDNFLYTEVGYPELRALSSGLFPSPYSITSIREYFAIGFETIFLGSPDDIKLNCPSVFRKISFLYNNYK